MDREELIRRLHATFLVELDEHATALEQGLLAYERATEEERPDLLVTLFRSAHSLKGAALAVDAAPIARACHHVEELLSHARNGHVLTAAQIELLLATSDALREAGALMEAGATGEPPGASALEALLPRLGVALRGTDAPPDARPVPGAPPGIRAPAALPPQPPAPTPPDRPDAAPSALRVPEGPRDVRVSAAKLDQLLASSTELLLVRTRASSREEALADLRDQLAGLRRQWRALEQHLTLGAGDRLAPRPLELARSLRRLDRLSLAADRLGDALRTDRHQLDQVASALEEQVRRVRMQPLSVACQGLDRAVRDAAHAAGRDVALEIRGGEVELDRTVLEGLRDPLLHLVRNAVIHGAEPPEVRAARGKPPRTTVRITATLRMDHVDIEVADDGAGLDLVAIRRRAAALGLAVPADEDEAARAILAPGLTTAEEVTDLSGRGMGLDVVRHQVQALHGVLAVRSTKGEGLRVRLRVPLTLATVRALLVRQGPHTYAIPTAGVDRLARLTPDEITQAAGAEVARVDGRPVPVVPLAQILARTSLGALGDSGDGRTERGSRAAGGARRPVVLLTAGGRRLLVEVSETLDVREVVVRSLGPRLRGVRTFAGATLLSSGRLALILAADAVVEEGLGIGDAHPRAAARRRPRILVADDVATTRGLIRGILEAAGYDVVTAADGAEAWERLQEAGADLVVTDVEMPRLDGIGLTAAIRGSAPHRGIPVVLLTALADEASRARGMEAGADAWLAKQTFDQRELLGAIAQLL